MLRRSRRRTRRRRLHSPPPSPPLAFADEILALIAARNKAKDTLARVRHAPPDTESLTRDLAVAIARGAGVEHFVQALGQLEALLDLRRKQIRAVTEFLRRFQTPIDQARRERRLEFQAAIQARISQLEEQGRQPGAHVAEIDAEVGYLKAELAPSRAAPGGRSEPTALQAPRRTTRKTSNA